MQGLQKWYVTSGWSGKLLGHVWAVDKVDAEYRADRKWPDSKGVVSTQRPTHEDVPRRWWRVWTKPSEMSQKNGVKSVWQGDILAKDEREARRKARMRWGFSGNWEFTVTKADRPIELPDHLAGDALKGVMGNIFELRLTR